MDYRIEKVVTALGRVFHTGSQPHQAGSGVIADATVEEITFTVGDPVIGLAAGYSIKLSDGRKVELENVVEVWYFADEPIMEGANAND
jgi:hypothetical protein